MAVLFSGFALLRDPGLFSVAQMQLSHTYEQKCFSQWVGAQATPGTVRLSGEVCHFGGMELRIRTSGAAAVLTGMVRKDLRRSLVIQEAVDEYYK